VARLAEQSVATLAHPEVAVAATAGLADLTGSPTVVGRVGRVGPTEVRRVLEAVEKVEKVEKVETVEKVSAILMAGLGCQHLRVPGLALTEESPWGLLGESRQDLPSGGPVAVAVAQTRCNRTWPSCLE
jgi:hypothetical protein